MKSYRIGYHVGHGNYDQHESTEQASELDFVAFRKYLMREGFTIHEGFFKPHERWIAPSAILWVEEKS